MPEHDTRANRAPIRGVAHPLIRAARREDLDAVAAFGAELVRMHHATNPARFLRTDEPEKGYRFWLGKELERPEAVVVVAEIDGAIVGYGYGSVEDRDWMILVDRHGAIHDLYVQPAARARGVGTALLRGLVSRLEQLGAPRILLNVMVQNEAAQRLFASAGFKPTMLEMTKC